MRGLEVVLVIGALLRLLVLAVNTPMARRLARPLTWVLGLVLVAHLLIEGYRVLMVPAYLVVMGFVFAAMRPESPSPDSPKPRSGIRTALIWIGVAVAAVIMIVPPYLLPVFKLPKPSGPFGVGSISFAVTDTSRRESFGTDHSQPRAFMVKVWYPVPAGTVGKLAPYASVEELASPVLKFPRAVARQYQYVRTHAVADAPLLTGEGKLPLLVFSHGYTGYSSQNTPQMEELASRGYAVFSISHSYDAAATVFPDGRIIQLDPEIIRGFGAAAAPEAAKKTMAALAQLNHASTPEERHTAFREYMVTGLPRIEQSVPVWAGDTRSLLDYLERVQPDQPAGRFSGHLDFDRVGIFGMSFGGSNAGEVCLIDRRCKAGLNIDGQQYGPLIDDSLSVPFMILASETAYGVHRAIYDRFQGPAYLIRLRGTQHVGLTDLPYLGPILFRKLGLTGTMPVNRSEQLMTDYIVAFFDTYLRGKPSAVLAEANPGSDVEVLVKNR